MQKLSKLHPGDKVAVLSPSFAAPGKFPKVYELGLRRLREIFELEPVEYPSTRKIGASKEERAKDLIEAFRNPGIKAVISTIGGDDQVTYIKNLPSQPFVANPKPFFGYSDNSHLMNFLWLKGISSFYGGSIMTQFAAQGEMDEYTINYLRQALFGEGEIELQPSNEFNEVGLDWGDDNNLLKRREYQKNEGWYWEGKADAVGITWGGCLESIDEILRHGIQMPSLKDFIGVVLITETSEKIPSHDYVGRVYRALGERGILGNIKALLVGRPKAWEFDKQLKREQRSRHREGQRDIIIQVVRKYNRDIPIVMNLDFGHTDPQIPIPYGGRIKIEATARRIFAEF